MTKHQKRNKENHSIHNGIKTIKYLRFNLTKGVKDLYNQNYKSLLKEIKEDINKWKDIPCSWNRRINTAKMAIPPIAIYRFSAILIKIPQAFWSRSRRRRNNLRIVGNHNYPQIDKTILRNKEQSQRHHTFWFQAIPKNYSNQNSMVLGKKHKYRSMEQNWEPRNKPKHI